MTAKEQPVNCRECNDRGFWVAFDGDVKECRSEECTRARAVDLLGEVASEEGVSQRELLAGGGFRVLATPIFIRPGVPYGLQDLKEESLAIEETFGSSIDVLSGAPPKGVDYADSTFTEPGPLKIRGR